MSTSTQTFNWEERDLAEEIENRAWQYVLEGNGTPNVAFLSTALFDNLCSQLMEIGQRPTLHVSKAKGRWIVIQTSSGSMNVYELDKYGSDFLFVGKITDIFPEDGQATLGERLLLEDSK